jgi:hypothetical protein
MTSMKWSMAGKTGLVTGADVVGTAAGTVG